ncbi:Protein of unknown function [Cupriavidus sp. OV038]|uniref:glucoamylase family protein n=1 Tax=unclassified Cupriavidus TaxID=2640874 RepID=UPI0008E5DE22|nr:MULTISPECIES: glucoamylase family protein [unclassified Cupriavidus]SFB67575.1 Protein of unknown function [Cupriavidus sp. OV038]SFO56738.1 Protein of unknown function [Cupriavidus sp. OV096]
MALDSSAHPLAHRAICIGLSALLVACGGGGSDEPVAPPAQPGTQARVDTGTEPAPTPTPQPTPQPTPAPIPAPTPTEVPPSDVAPDVPVQPDPQAALKAEARIYAKSLWKSIEAMETKPAFPSNKACVNAENKMNAVNWMFIGELASYISNVVAARDLGLITPEDASQRMARMLPAIAVLQQQAKDKGAPGGLFLGSLNSTTGVPDGDVGVIENAWVATGLAMAKQAFPELAAQAGAILAQMRFDTMLDPQKQQFYINYNPATQQNSGSTYDLMSETRLISYAAIALGNVPRSQYFHLDRVPEWAERSIDQSKYRTYEGVRVYEASRSFGGQSFIPTWGGSVFETFAVPIMINEQKWGTNSWARSHPNMAKAQIQYGLDQFGYWGFSPATIPATGGYTEYGAPPLSVAGGYRPVGQRESTRAGPVVSPYSVLSLIEYEPEAVMDAMRKLITNFPALDHPTYGLMDSVDVQTGVVSNCALYLDNSLALGAVANYLTDGKLRGYVDKEWGHILQPLLEIEEFSIPAQQP